MEWLLATVLMVIVIIFLDKKKIVKRKKMKIKFCSNKITMKALLISFILSLCTLMMGCQASGEMQKEVINNKFSIEMPSYFNSIYISPESYSYGSMSRELFVSITDKYKNDPTYEEIGDVAFAEFLIKDFKSQIIVESESEVEATKINGHDAYIINLTGTLNNSNAFVILAFIQGQKDFYSIMAWSSASRQFQNKETLEEIVFSFKEK